MDTLACGEANCIQSVSSSGRETNPFDCNPPAPVELSTTEVIGASRESLSWIETEGEFPGSAGPGEPSGACSELAMTGNDSAFSTCKNSDETQPELPLKLTCSQSPLESLAVIAITSLATNVPSEVS